RSACCPVAQSDRTGSGVFSPGGVPARSAGISRAAPPESACHRPQLLASELVNGNESRCSFICDDGEDPKIKGDLLSTPFVSRVKRLCPILESIIKEPQALPIRH